MNAYINYPLHVNALIDDLWIATGLVVVVTEANVRLTTIQRLRRL